MTKMRRGREALVKAIATGLFLVLLGTLALGTSPIRSYENNVCICGVKKALLVLADFPEYPHLSESAEIESLFFNRVARYFYDASYGRLMVTGNSTDWIRLPKLYSQYGGNDLHTGVVAIAQDAFNSASQSFNITAFDFLVLVLSFYPSLTGDFIPTDEHRIATRTGPVAGFAVVEESSDWSAYAHAFALSLGLWHVQEQLSGIGGNDMAASGQGDMSVWSKAKLGWINDSQIVMEDAPGSRDIVTLDPVEAPGSDPLAIRIRLGVIAGEYWVEVRQPLGYDRNNLREYGALISYVQSDNAPIQMKKVLQPDILSRAVFLDPDVDLSIIVLNSTLGRFTLLIGNEQDGRDAQVALYAASRAQEAIQTAETEKRFQTLDLAQQLLANSHLLFGQGKFRDSSALAVSAETTADSATVPEDYTEAAQLITHAQALKNETLNAGPQTAPLVQQANTQLDIATHAFEARSFTLAKQAAQSAVNLYDRARQMQLYESTLTLIGDVLLILPVIILAFALRYQLKRS
jgi:hypothetical protein